jgi:hypothetical protein
MVARLLKVKVAILRDYGITEEFIGAPILATMEVERIGETDGIPVYADKFACKRRWHHRRQPNQTSHRFLWTA